MITHHKGVVLVRTSIISLTLFLLAATLSFAESFTGQDYLNLSRHRRIEVVSAYRQHALQDGVIIKEIPVYYCQRLDAFYEKHPDWKQESMNTVLKTLMIMEYDWNEPGISKDELALNWLGEDLYRANRARFE
ncbi:hypothetical protein ACFL42_00780 [Candidatus Omnitrophota bacterium]